MEIGVGTTATMPGIGGEAVLDWARAADAGPWSTLGIIDRIAYPNHEPLATLAAFAGATSRIGLMTTVLVAPIRNAGLLAKQTATIDSLSGGRLSLGLGVGGREEDYLAASSCTDFSRRGRHFEEQIDLMRRIWAGEAPRDDVAPIGPRPVRDGGPPILLGGYSEVAARRAGRLADGFIAGQVSPAQAREYYDAAQVEREEAGRDGDLRFVGCAYWGLGDDETLEHGRAYVRDYYSFGGDRAEKAAAGILTDAAAIRERLAAAEEVGFDEFILWPTVGDVDQLDRLAEAVA
jgi:alkanesulfonate monooxygenase SsuD/methylene tetrahydromethanopterin reductase-like flavin-dependent oxidoreductase (luciferase family)